MGGAEHIFDDIMQRGEAAIRGFLGEKQEHLYLDFKQSHDCGTGAKLHKHDLANFRKAISAFGNTEGGVIVWGVKCTRDATGADLPSELLPITNPARFKGWLENAVQYATVPPHQGVRNEIIPPGAPARGFVISLVPMSEQAPLSSEEDRRYYMRAGSASVEIPRGILASMFGRRPQPSMELQWRFAGPGESGTCNLDLILRNSGLVPARDAYLTIVVPSLPSVGSEASLGTHEDNKWTRSPLPDRGTSAIAIPNLRMAPGMECSPLCLSLRLTPPFTHPLGLTGCYGCDGMPPKHFRITRTPDEIEVARLLLDRHPSKEQLTEMAAKLFRTDDVS